MHTQHQHVVMRDICIKLNSRQFHCRVASTQMEQLVFHVHLVISVQCQENHLRGVLMDPTRIQRVQLLAYNVQKGTAVLIRTSLQVLALLGGTVWQGMTHAG